MSHDRHPGFQVLRDAEARCRAPAPDAVLQAMADDAVMVRNWSSDLDSLAAAERILTLIAAGNLG